MAPREKAGSGSDDPLPAFYSLRCLNPQLFIDGGQVLLGRVSALLIDAVPIGIHGHEEGAEGVQSELELVVRPALLRPELPLQLHMGGLDGRTAPYDG